MHVLIMLLSSCLSWYAQVNKYEDGYDVCDKIYNWVFLLIFVSVGQAYKCVSFFSLIKETEPTASFLLIFYIRAL